MIIQRLALHVAMTTSGSGLKFVTWNSYVSGSIAGKILNIGTSMDQNLEALWKSYCKLIEDCTEL